MAVAVASCYATMPAWALNGADFSAVVGTVTPGQTGNVKDLTLTTSTDRTLAEIKKRFNVAADEKLSIMQPSSSSLFLLRVVRDQGILEKSVIDGTIYSNGQFWLQNAAGVLISKGAVIDTKGFLATSMAVRHEDFLAARLTSLKGVPDVDGIVRGDIVNEGTITTGSNGHVGGYVYLVGANVTNKGLITTPGGETILAAGQTVNLIDTGTPGVKVEITGAEGNVTNLSEIAATAGRIGMAGVIVRNSGQLNASSVVSEGGRIFLKASQDTYVDGKGRIVATGTKGGKAEVLGNRVTVTDDAEIDVSGTNGGGTILVGGDYQGKNPDVQNAQITYFGPNAKLKANAIDKGDGGKIIIWADDITRAYGNIFARGGAFGGNGGFVEVSGHRYLDYQGFADRSAPMGKAGTLLLDPSSVCVYASSSAACSYGASTMSWATIDSNLYGGAVIVSTDGSTTSDIDVVEGYTYNRSNALSFLAYGSFRMLGPTIQNNGTGDITVVAGWNGTGTNFTQDVGSINIGQGGGTDYYTGIYHPYISGKIITGGNIVLKAGHSIGIDYIQAGGDVTVQAGRSIWDGNWQTSGATNISAAGTVSLTSDQGWDWSQCYNQNCSAISVDVAGSTGSIDATVGGTYGGIRIGVEGNASYVLHDNSSSAAYNSVELRASGNVNTGGASSFYGRRVYIDAGGDLAYNGNVLGYQGSGSLDELGLMAGGNLTVNAATPTTSKFTGLFGGSSVAINANVASNGFVVLGSGKVEKKDSIETPAQLGDIPMVTGGTVTITNAAVSGATGVGFLSGSLTMTGSTVASSAGPIYGALTKDLRLNNGAIMSSASGVNLALQGSDSTIYLNDTATYASPSKIESGTSINVKFMERSSGGIVIDGASTSTTASGGSGFYVGGAPASPGSGLNLVYNQAVASAIQTTVINTIIASTTQVAPPAPPIVIPPPPPTGGTTGSLPGTGTIGGGGGQFGSSDTGGTTGGGNGGAGTGGSGSGSGEGSSAIGGGSGQAQGDGKPADNGKDQKDAKKDDKKDDKTGGGKQGDKPSGKKPVGRCNA